ATVFSYAAHHAPIYPGQPAPKQDRQASHPGVTAPSNPGSGTVPGSPGSHPRTVDLSRLSPSGGSAHGGDNVTITGADFTGATAVHSGATPRAPRHPAAPHRPGRAPARARPRSAPRAAPPPPAPPPGPPAP